MEKIKPTGLACFSPPVMIATFIIEIVLAMVVVWRYKLNRLGQLAVAMLVFLAIFQFAEYNICAVSWGLDPLTWSRVGYVAITLLPPLGVHLAYELAGATKRPLLPWVYGAAAAFVGFFLFIGHSLVAQACLGNYVIFEQAPGSQWLYAAYYYGLLFTGLGLCWHLAKTQDSAGRRALFGLIVGYFAFMFPTATLNIVDSSTIAGIPSIMCGFAVLYAVLLVVYILPVRAQKRR